MRKEELEAHSDLVTIKFGEIQPEEWSRKWRAEFGTDEVGLIPLEVSIELLQERLLDINPISINPVIVEREIERLLEKPTRCFAINDQKGNPEFFLFEIDGFLHIPNFIFDDFMKVFMGSKNQILDQANDSEQVEPVENDKKL